MKKSWIIVGIILIILIWISPYILHGYNEMEFNKKRGESYREAAKKIQTSQPETE